MAKCIEVANLYKSYGGLAVLQDVSLDVNDGETLAIIGPNGAGKTTMFKVITGEAPANGGVIKYAGRQINDLSPERRTRLGFGRTFQVSRVFPSNTVRENLIVAIEARNRNAGVKAGKWYNVAPLAEIRDEADRVAERVDLASKRDVEARYLSHGDKKRLEFAAMLCLRPRVLMLDEPTAGMSSTDRVQVTKLIQRIKTEEQVTVMLTEHDMDVVFGLSDRILVLNFGRVVACDTPDNIRNNREVRTVYLGNEAN